MDNISKWANQGTDPLLFNLLLVGFEPLAEELSNTVIELIENEKDVEKLEGYVTALHHLLKVVKWDETITEPRRIWIKFWRTLNQMIEDDWNREVTSFCIHEVGNCIETMSKGVRYFRLGIQFISIQATQLFADSVLDEIGIMVKNLFEKEMRRRDNVCELHFERISDLFSE